MSRNAVYIVGIVALAGLAWYAMTINEVNAPFKTIHDDLKSIFS